MRLIEFDDMQYNENSFLLFRFSYTRHIQLAPPLIEDSVVSAAVFILCRLNNAR